MSVVRGWRFRRFDICEKPSLSRHERTLCATILHMCYGCIVRLIVYSMMINCIVRDFTFGLPIGVHSTEGEGLRCFL